jgi:hypothetical protein
MNEIIGGLSTGFIVIFPTIRFYQICSWTKKQNLIGILGVSFLWFLLQSPLHELSHMMGAKLVGVNIIDYQLLPKYWTGDFTLAYIKVNAQTIFQEFVITAAPYFRDLIIAILGCLILNTKRIHHFFIVGFLFSLFLLNSAFDIVTNFSGYLISEFGDFNKLSKLIGHFWTCFFGISILSIIIFLTYRIFIIYKGFPIRTKGE